MKKSIFTRYISTFLIIVFLSFSVLTVIISSMTVRYANNQKKNIAIKTSEVIYNYLSSEKFYPSVTTLVNEFTKMIDLLSHNAEKLSIIITDTSGSIRFATDNITGEIKDDDILEIGTGEDMILTKSTLDGIFPIDYTVIITPLVYSPSERAGIMLVCYNSHTVNELAVSTVRTIVIASLWVMIITLVAVYFITEKIVSPLRQMNAATKKFSAGQFDIRMNVKGEDEIAELAASFNRMAESLANIEYTRSSFLANVSHDLRTPMTTISGFIDGILDGAIPPEKQNYYLNIIAQEIRRLSRLVSQLLDISRMESGNRKFEKTNFDICEMARIILISFEGKIEEKNLDVDFTSSSDRLFVYSDKDAINQVLYNLCDNAVKFSRPGGKYLISIDEAPSDKIRVKIFNEGEGISAEDLPNVFDRFYKSDRSRGKDKIGVGLGLYISKTIMDNLGEQISVRSEQGNYCEFTLNVSKSKISDAKILPHQSQIDKSEK